MKTVHKPLPEGSEFLEVEKPKGQVDNDSMIEGWKAIFREYFQPGWMLHSLKGLIFFGTLFAVYFLGGLMGWW